MGQLRHGTLEGVGRAKLAHVLRYRVVLFDELVYRHEAATNTQDQVVVLDLHNHLVREVAVAASRLPHEQSFHTLFRIALIYEIGEFCVNRVILLRYVFEVNFVKLAPVPEHFLELSVSVTERLHLYLVSLQLCRRLLQLFLYRLNMYGILLI